MSDTREFFGAFRDTARSLGSWRLLTPTDVIGSWRGSLRSVRRDTPTTSMSFATISLYAISS